MTKLKLKDLGEKEIIRKIIKPLFNPNNKLELLGDDCAVIDVSREKFLCISTDRVPADLISFKLGLINFFELGYYLVILNISDIVANGGSPSGILLTFAFNEDFLIEDLKHIINGVKKACDEYDCKVMGGDLSNSAEINISATSIGTIRSGKILYRAGAKAKDHIYCSDFLGLTSTAFYYFLKAKPAGLSLPKLEEKLLVDQFKKPRARLELSRKLSANKYRITCMDNTDGIAQSFMELSEINNLKFELQRDLLPIHKVSFKIANFLKLDVLEIVLGGGADFQLLGTIEGDVDKENIKHIISREIIIIGQVYKGRGLWIREETGENYEYNVPGWDYYSSKTNLPGDQH